MLKTVSTGIGGTTGALVYQGLWNASANSPTLTSSVGTQGYYYVVSVAGTTNLNGITDWAVNDWAVFNGSIWQKIDNSETVYGTMATQNANAVIITGGTINSVTENACTYTNVSISSGNATFTNANATNSTITNLSSGNVTLTGGTTNNLTQTNVTISSGNATLTNINATLTNTNNVQVRALTGYVYANNTANATASTTIPNAGLANSTLTLGNATLTLGSTTTSVGNLTLSNATISSGSVAINVANVTSNTSSTATMSTANLPLVPQGYLYVNLNGTQVKVPYYAV